MYDQQLGRETDWCCGSLDLSTKKRIYTLATEKSVSVGLFADQRVPARVIKYEVSRIDYGENRIL
jgi:hypothetical protein